MCPSFPFGIEGGMWDVIELIPDHRLSIYFKRMGQAIISRKLAAFSSYFYVKEI